MLPLIVVKEIVMLDITDMVEEALELRKQGSEKVFKVDIGYFKQLRVSCVRDGYILTIVDEANGKSLSPVVRGCDNENDINLILMNRFGLKMVAGIREILQNVNDGFNHVIVRTICIDANIPRDSYRVERWEIKLDEE